ncbi:hypothetical protein R5N98_15450 [Tenacibaculum maritimum]|uniref:hypothetical protein n=1 Tax=Tenacibaculum maritimum TaxID=107401 RepID=UPI0012E685CE|nr:hypothetical protein [Tenacibaculum maritimum]CAA0173458.1 conserved hypothetical protein [Tenacibaculum maritimum]CAA0231701.1 conserved hypothetical protein [Tenacibaculum maritimum]CAA0239355.1 conserved hypothetical protein [Tenacibaculum maritimum]CAA0240966.1 conserved hypothetical protein [Tenacibaculum maritimum]CAA0244023.1 conserved hypothetical protein [Tenacibaculum maritimum]
MNLVLMILAAVVVAFILALVIVKFVPLKMRWLVSLLLLGASVYLGWKIYEGVMSPIKFNEDKQIRYAKVIQNLKLIRDAEVKYKQVYGTYTKNKDTLLNFIETGKLALTETKNVEEKVDKGGGIFVTVSKRKIDTIGYEDVKKYFDGKDYKNMFNVPNTAKQYTLETAEIEKVAGLVVPVFEAKIDKETILKGMDRSLVKRELEAVETDQIKGAFVSVGSLEDVTTGGNWPPSYDKMTNIAKK